MITYSLIFLIALGCIYALVRFTQERTRKAEWLRLEARLGEAQRLETLGQLTSGIAPLLDPVGIANSQNPTQFL